MANHNELVKVFTEYVALLEKELAANVDFLNQNGKPVSPADIAKGQELVAKISSLKNSGE